jgi:hypothetical protein
MPSCVTFERRRRLQRLLSTAEMPRLRKKVCGPMSGQVLNNIYIYIHIYIYI